MKRRFLFQLLCVVVLGILVFNLPLFHVKPLSVKIEQEQSTVFNAAQVVVSEWNTRMRKAIRTAPELDAFLQAYAEDPSAALDTYGKNVGLSANYHFMLMLNAEVIAREEHSLVLRPISSNNTLIEVRDGPVFGDSVRDGSGLFSVANFSDTRRFNEVSAELNNLVENEVLASLFERAKLGESIKSVGCFTLNKKRPDIKKINWIPVHFEIQR